MALIIKLSSIISLLLVLFTFVVFSTVEVEGMTAIKRTAPQVPPMVNPLKVLRINPSLISTITELWKVVPFNFTSSRVVPPNSNEKFIDFIFVGFACDTRIYLDPKWSPSQCYNSSPTATLVGYNVYGVAPRIPFSDRWSASFYDGTLTWRIDASQAFSNHGVPGHLYLTSADGKIKFNGDIILSNPSSSIPHSYLYCTIHNQCRRS